MLARFLELVLEGLVSHLAMDLPLAELGPVLDLVEGSVRVSQGIPDGSHDGSHESTALVPGHAG